MASLPATPTYPWYLREGLISIYGVGFNTPPDYRTIAQSDMIYGIVNQVWDNGNIGAEVGDRVYWKVNSEVCVLAYDNVPYTIIEENKIIITEPIILPP